MRNLDVFGALKGNYLPQNAFLDEACLLLEHYIFNALRRAYKLEASSNWNQRVKSPSGLLDSRLSCPIKILLQQTSTGKFFYFSTEQGT